MIVSLAWDKAATGKKDVRFAGFAGLVVSLALAKHVLHRPLAEAPIVDDPSSIALRSHLVELIRESVKPSLSEDMTLLLRAGQPLPIEPAIFAELAMTGVWDQRPFVQSIENYSFAPL
jgi:hypothetical protein